MEIQPEEAEKISQGFPFLANLSLSGGEPFLREDLPELCTGFKKGSRIKILTIPTNSLLPERIQATTRRICSSLRDVSVEIELSIDGPPNVHDSIRGVEGNFALVEETARRLKSLKRHHQNLLIKGNITFCSLNQESLDELLPLLPDRLGLDRVSLSFLHGNPRNPRVREVDPLKFLEVHRRIIEDPRLSGRGFYSAAASTLKSLYAESVVRNLETRMMDPACTAGTKILVIDEVCKVFPCEGIANELGDLREEGYDIRAILNSEKTLTFLRDYVQARACYCSWGCATIHNLVYHPKTYPTWLLRTARNIVRSRMPYTLGPGHRQGQGNWRG